MLKILLTGMHMLVCSWTQFVQ